MEYYSKNIVHVIVCWTLDRTRFWCFATNIVWGCQCWVSVRFRLTFRALISGSNWKLWKKWDWCMVIMRPDVFFFSFSFFPPGLSNVWWDKSHVKRLTDPRCQYKRMTNPQTWMLSKPTDGHPLQHFLMALSFLNHITHILRQPSTSMAYDLEADKRLD